MFEIDAKEKEETNGSRREIDVSMSLSPHRKHTTIMLLRGGKRGNVIIYDGAVKQVCKCNLKKNTGSLLYRRPKSNLSQKYTTTVQVYQENFDTYTNTRVLQLEKKLQKHTYAHF